VQGSRITGYWVVSLLLAVMAIPKAAIYRPLLQLRETAALMALVLTLNRER
jgi:hypothetical protein